VAALCSVKGRIDSASFGCKVGGMAEGQGSAGNVIAALASFFIPGLGQLIQGRLLIALVMFLLAAALWVILMGWIIHLWSIIDAALWKPKG
jgi:TM2 domain-containing membrane protein YozV